MQTADSHRIWGAATNGVRISVAVTKTTVAVGEPLEVSIVFRNDGDEGVHFGRASMWFEYDHTVIGPDGRQAAFTVYGQRLKDNLAEQGGTLLEVAPGTELSSRLEISQLYDFSRPGEYTITVVKQVARADRQSFFGVTSNRATVTVQP